MTDRKTIVLHIGLPKTGSSALQSFFANNAETFRRHGVHYPNHPSQDDARNGRVTSGNAPGLYLKTQQRRAHEFFEATTRHADDCATLLLSSEFLGKLEPADITHLVAARPTDWDLKVICFVRDVYPLLWSTYGQNVKGGGLTVSFAERLRHLKEPYSHGKTLTEWSSWLTAGQLRAFHYESHATSLMKTVTEEIQVPYSVCEPVAERVNRGLAPVEVEVLRSLNASHKGWLSKEISDALLDRSDLSPHLPYYDDAVDFVTKKYQGVVQEINERFFSARPALSLGIPSADSGDAVTPEATLDLYRKVAEIASEIGARKAHQLQLIEARELLEANPRRAQKLLRETLRREPGCAKARDLLDALLSFDGQ